MSASWVAELELGMERERVIAALNRSDPARRLKSPLRRDEFSDQCIGIRARVRLLPAT
jgi:hypothetical protein